MATLALGCGALGNLERAQAFAVLDAAYAVGVRTFDLARSYGAAEDHVGAWHNGREVTLLTKGGYGVAGVQDWTGEAIHRGAIEACQRLQVDRLSGFLLHSCVPAVLDRDDVRAVLPTLPAIAIGYSGDGDDLHQAIDRAPTLGFSLIEQSLSLLDGSARIHTFPRAVAASCSVIAKRVLANAPWSNTSDAHDVQQQRQRFARADLPDVGMPWDELFLRFAAATPGLSTLLVGTSRPEAIERAALLLKKGPLPRDVLHALQPALARCDLPSIT